MTPKAIAAATMRDSEKTMMAVRKIAENTRGKLDMDRELELLRNIEALVCERYLLRAALTKLSLGHYDSLAANQELWPSTIASDALRAADQQRP